MTSEDPPTSSVHTAQGSTQISATNYREGVNNPRYKVLGWSYYPLIVVLALVMTNVKPPYRALITEFLLTATGELMWN